MCTKQKALKKQWEKGLENIEAPEQSRGLKHLAIPNERYNTFTVLNFACASGQLRAKPSVFCKYARLFELKNEDAIKKSENLCNTCAY
jgi:hypothetical protein